MKILFATKNPAKIKYYAEELKRRKFDILTLSDLEEDINMEIEENGKNGVENAKIKARAYHEITGIKTICIDDNLFINGLNEEKQPGTNVRRVNGKRLTDEEMIDYYSNLVHELGGKVNAKWVKGVAIYDGKEMKSYEYSRNEFYFIDTPSNKVREGYPLDSISIIPGYEKYLSEFTEQELYEYKNKDKNNDVFEFIINNI